MLENGWGQMMAVLCGIFRYLLVYEGLSELHWSTAAPKNDGELLTRPRWIFRFRRLGVGCFGVCPVRCCKPVMIRTGITREPPAFGAFSGTCSNEWSTFIAEGPWHLPVPESTHITRVTVPIRAWQRNARGRAAI